MVLKEEINKLRELNNNLLDDKKEMELKILELTKENMRLNKNNLDYNKWREWDSTKVFYFTMNSVNDGSLDELKNQIKNEIFESEYCGKDLEEMDINELKAMGIKKISVRRAVYKAIQKLTQNKSQIDEGVMNAPTAYI